MDPLLPSGQLLLLSRPLGPSCGRSCTPCPLSAPGSLAAPTLVSFLRWFSDPRKHWETAWLCPNPVCCCSWGPPSAPMTFGGSLLSGSLAGSPDVPAPQHASSSHAPPPSSQGPLDPHHQRGPGEPQLSVWPPGDCLPAAWATPAPRGVEQTELAPGLAVGGVGPATAAESGCLQGGLGTEPLTELSGNSGTWCPLPLSTRSTSGDGLLASLWGQKVPGRCVGSEQAVDPLWGDSG